MMIRGVVVPVEIVHVMNVALEVDMSGLDDDVDRVLVGSDSFTHHSSKTVASKSRAVVLH